MEDLLRSLRNLGLKAPVSSQLLELLDDDEQVQERLARILSLSSLDEDSDGNDEGGGGAAALMGQELLQEAVKALLDNFQRSLKKQRQMAEKERVGGMRTIKWPPRKAILARHAAALQRSEQEREQSPTYRPRLVFDGSDSYCSTSKLSQLRPVQCADLKEAPKRYTGCYLLCKVVTSLLLYAGVTFIVDDPSGAALPVSVSHFTTELNLTTEQVSNLLPVGTVLAIREPFISLDHQARAGPCYGKPYHGIRVDSPTDILLWQDEDQNSNSWEEAVEMCACRPSHWLRLSEEPSIKTNRDLEVAVEQLMKSDRPGQAYREICKARQSGLIVSPSLEGRLLFQMDAWDAAKIKFDQNESLSSDEDVEADVKAASDFSLNITQLSDRQASLRCYYRIQQSLHGISTEDMQSIYFAAAKGVTRLDTADYIGPLEVRNIPGAGRGLITTRAVEAGELLLCCRAICASYPQDEECKGSPLLRLHLESGVVSTTSQVLAQTKLIHAIVDRPELALPILGLTAGPSIAHSEYVSQEYPLRTTCNLKPDLCDSQRANVDAAYVDGVLRFNAFGPAQTPSRGEKDNSMTGELQRSTMPHPLPAILNHACLPNVSSVFFSNIVTTRALCSLPKGTEIVHQYVKGEEPLAIRTANLSKHRFQCDCVLCTLDREDGLENCRIRARIIQGESKAVLDRSTLLLKGSTGINGQANEDEEAHDDIVESLESLLARIDATYSRQRGSLKPDLFVVMDARTRHIARKSTEDAITSAKEALTCVGAIVDSKAERRVLQLLPKLHFDSCIALILFMATLLAQNGAKEQSLAWTESAFWAHQCMIGGGVEKPIYESNHSTTSESTDVFADRWDIDDYKPALQLRREMIK